MVYMLYYFAFALELFTFVDHYSRREHLWFFRRQAASPQLTRELTEIDHLQTHSFDRILSIEVRCVLNVSQQFPHTLPSRCLNTWKITKHCSRKYLRGWNQDPQKKKPVLPARRCLTNRSCLSISFATALPHTISLKTTGGWQRISFQVGSPANLGGTTCLDIFSLLQAGQCHPMTFLYVQSTHTTHPTSAFF